MILKGYSQIKERRALINDDKSALLAYIMCIEEYKAILDKFASKNPSLTSFLSEKLALLDQVLACARQLSRELTKLWFIYWKSNNFEKRLNAAQELTESTMESITCLNEWNEAAKKICPSHGKGNSCLICYDNDGEVKTRMSSKLNRRLRPNKN